MNLHLDVSIMCSLHSHLMQKHTSVQNEEAKCCKAGVYNQSNLADLNQQNTEPHLRQLANYFIDGNVVDPGPSAGHAGMESKSKDARSCQIFEDRF